LGLTERAAIGGKGREFSRRTPCGLPRPEQERNSPKVLPRVGSRIFLCKKVEKGIQSSGVAKHDWGKAQLGNQKYPVAVSKNRGACAKIKRANSEKI